MLKSVAFEKLVIYTLFNIFIVLVLYRGLSSEEALAPLPPWSKGP